MISLLGGLIEQAANLRGKKSNVNRKVWNAVISKQVRIGPKQKRYRRFLVNIKITLK